jgi:hypothetical protein
MRFTTMIAAAAALVLTGTTAVQAAPYSDAAPAVHAVTVAPLALMITAAQEPQSAPDVKVDITTSKGGGGTWYTQPMWPAIGGLALLVIILVVVMAGRNNTTVVK